MGGISQSQRFSTRSEAPEPTSGSPTQGSCTRKTSPRTSGFEKQQGLCSGEPPGEAGSKPQLPLRVEMLAAAIRGRSFYQGNTALARDALESSHSLLVLGLTCPPAGQPQAQGQADSSGKPTSASNRLPPSTWGRLYSQAGGQTRHRRRGHP